MTSDGSTPGARPVACLFTAAFGVALLAAAGFAAGLEPDLVRLALSVVVSSAGFAALALAGALASTKPLGASLGLDSAEVLPSVWQAALIVLGMVALSHLADLGLEWTGWADHSRLRTLDDLLRGARDGPLAVATLGLALAPGLAEELLFRGYLLGAIAGRAGMPAAIIASSLLFGAVHLELAHALAATLLGLYLARVAVVGGGIRLAILCHVANNLTAVVLAAFASSDRYGSEAVRGTDALLALGSVIALAAALVQLTRNARAAASADG